MVTTAGGVEEDLIKCLAPTYKGDFSLPGALLRSKGLNRIGNLLVPNENYCKFEDWIIPIFDQMLKEQVEEVFLCIINGCNYFLFSFLFPLFALFIHFPTSCKSLMFPLTDLSWKYEVSVGTSGFVSRTTRKERINFF